MLNLIGVKCGKDIYIQTTSKNLIINGCTTEATFASDWQKIKKEPTTVQKYEKQPDINHRYKLKDSAPAAIVAIAPAELLRETATTYDEHEYERNWNPEYRDFKSFYELICDKQEPILIDVEFAFELVVEVNKILNPKDFSYNIQWDNRCFGEETRKLYGGEIASQLIDKIIFPDIVLPSRPCSLTPRQSYKIVRQYIKQHLNYDRAKITSDYDFCLTVKKIIPLSEVETYSTDANFMKKTKRKKLVKRYRKDRSVEVYAVSPEGYGDYPTIQGFRGEDQDDLKNNIDTYCEDLVKMLNEPVVDCDKCKGRGVLLSS